MNFGKLFLILVSVIVMAGLASCRGPASTDAPTAIGQVPTEYVSPTAIIHVPTQNVSPTIAPDRLQEEIVGVWMWGDPDDRHTWRFHIYKADGIYCYSSDGNSILTYCLVRYAGYSNYGGVRVYGTSSVDMSNCIVEFTGGTAPGVHVDGGDLDLIDCEIRDNNYRGVYFQSGTGSIRNNKLLRNSAEGLRLLSGAQLSGFSGNQSQDNGGYGYVVDAENVFAASADRKGGGAGRGHGRRGSAGVPWRPRRSPCLPMSGNNPAVPWLTP